MEFSLKRRTREPQVVWILHLQYSSYVPPVLAGPKAGNHQMVAENPLSNGDDRGPSLLSEPLDTDGPPPIPDWSNAMK